MRGVLSREEAEELFDAQTIAKNLYTSTISQALLSLSVQVNVMKIIGINSSPKGEASRTRKLVEAVLRGAENNSAETAFIDLCSLRIEYCSGCGVCYTNGECIHEDDYPELFDTMLEADGIVFGSPVYIDGVTAQLKTLFDRMADAIHCQMLDGKYGCAVSTTGSAGDAEVIAYMNKVLNLLGALSVGGVGVAIGADIERLVPAEGKAERLGYELASAIREKRNYAEQEELIAERRKHFKNLVIWNKNLWWHEYEYWIEKGWID
jgi:multimeric flavodoxin WrbA